MAKRTPIDHPSNAEQEHRRRQSDQADYSESIRSQPSRPPDAPTRRLLSTVEVDRALKAGARAAIAADATKGIYHRPEDVEQRLRENGYPLEADRRRRARGQ